MNASDLRPNSDASDNSPLKTGPGHQPTHLLPGDPRAPFPVYECQRCRMLSPEKPRASCMQGYADGCPMVEPQVLTKVLPAGGPLLGQEPECRRCPGCTNQGACHDDGKGEK